MSNNFYLAPGEEFTSCPYSMAHRITTAKELTHITKCRENYLKQCKEDGIIPEMVACRYVFSHQIPLVERDYHEERCKGQGRYGVASHLAYHGSEEFREKIKKERPEKVNDKNHDEEAPERSPSPRPKSKSRPVRIKQEPIGNGSPYREEECDEFGRVLRKDKPRSRSRSRSKSRSRERNRRRKSRSSRSSRSHSRSRERKYGRDRSWDKKSHKSRDRDRDRRRSRSRSRSRERKRGYNRRSSSPEYEKVSTSRHKHKHSKKKPPTPPLLTTADLGDENWDEDCKEGYEPGYDPKVKLETDCILYNPMGLKKSERKKFRLENRKKAKMDMDMEELPAVEPVVDVKPNLAKLSEQHEQKLPKPNFPSSGPSSSGSGYKPTPTYPPEEMYPPPHHPGPPGGYGPPPPRFYRGPPHPHGYGPPPPHMMHGYGPPPPYPPHMGPGPGFYGPPMGPPGYGPPPMMGYGRPPPPHMGMGPPHPHFGYGPPPPMMHPHYDRPPMHHPGYDPPPPVDRRYSPPPPVERRYSPPPRIIRPSPPPRDRDIKPKVKDLEALVNAEVTAPVLVKRDPDEPFEDGEIDDDLSKNDVKPSQTEDYDWNPDDD